MKINRLSIPGHAAVIAQVGELDVPRERRANLSQVFDRTQIIDRQFAFAVNGELPGPVE
jgi:hypothetical protein